MNKAIEQQQIRQLEQLVKTAKNPKQKAQFKELLEKVKSQLPPEPKKETQTHKETKTPAPPQPDLIIEPTSKSQTKNPTEAQPEAQSKGLIESKTPTQSQSKKSPKTLAEPKSEPLPESIQKPKTPPPVFSAIGLIQGDVILKNSSKLWGEIKIGENRYKINVLSFKRAGFREELGDETSYNKPILVYPQITHFPDPNLPHKISFQIMGWGENLLNRWKVFEFHFNGIWQFIPPCRTPVISVFKNKANRLDGLNNDEKSILHKVNFLKAAHLPTVWKDAPVKPFRFNPKSEEQADSYFVQIGATFLPERNLWGFRELRGEPSKKIPKYLKLRKEDKAAALKELQKRKAEQSKAKKESLVSKEVGELG